MTIIPVDVRKRIIHLYDSGKTTHQIAGALGYCKAAVRRIRQHWRERGTLEPRTHLRGRKGKFTPPMAERLRQEVASRPDATLAELAQALSTSDSTIDRWLRKLDISLKKRRRMPSSRIVPT